MNFALTSNLFHGFGHYRNDVLPVKCCPLRRDRLRDHSNCLLEEEVEVLGLHRLMPTVPNIVLQYQDTGLVDIPVTADFKPLPRGHDLTLRIRRVPFPVLVDHCDDLVRNLRTSFIVLSHLFLR